MSKNESECHLNYSVICYYSIMEESIKTPTLPMSAFREITMSPNYFVISSQAFFYQPVPHKVFSRSFTLGQDELSSRSWNEISTRYVVLKYFYWTYNEPTVMSLHEMYKTISASLALDIGIHKTPTQIRDKINNIKSGYRKDSIRRENHGQCPLKFVTPALYEVMDKYLDESKRHQFVNVLKEISQDVKRLLEGSQ